MAAPLAPVRHTSASNTMIFWISLEALDSNDDVLLGVPLLLIIIFVSCPVFTTMPMTQSVLRRTQPRRRTLFAPVKGERQI